MAEEGSHSVENWIMWAALAVAPLLAAWAYSAGDRPEAAWESAGAVLEITGFLVVIADLELRLERFGDRLGPVAEALRWTAETAQRVLRKLGIISGRTVKMKAESGGISLNGSAHVSVKRAAPFPGVRGEIVRLERMIGDLESQIEKVECEAADERGRLEERLRSEITNLRGEVEAVKVTVRQSVAAGFGLELTGVGLFLFGVVLGTWGPGIENAVTGMF